ncbi:hypothetical protein J2743_000423 [Methanobacterium petrolearium]|nr:hypothetical protein [Methanobacterium petrolearium]BDZ71007.1 hypothetical protein GCM10025861_15240 [Methanobacterium petrolearium]
MELNRYYKPLCIIVAIGVLLSWIFKLNPLFYLLIMILGGLSLGKYENKEGKSGFFYLGLLGLMCLIPFLFILLLIFIQKLLQYFI